MAGQRNCDAVVAAGRMSKASEFLDAAVHLGEEMPNAAGDLYVNAGIPIRQTEVRHPGWLVERLGREQKENPA